MTESRIKYSNNNIPYMLKGYIKAMTSALSSLSYPVALAVAITSEELLCVAEVVWAKLMLGESASNKDEELKIRSNYKMTH